MWSSWLSVSFVFRPGSALRMWSSSVNVKLLMHFVLGQCQLCDLLGSVLLMHFSVTSVCDLPGSELLIYIVLCQRHLRDLPWSVLLMWSSLVSVAYVIFLGQCYLCDLPGLVLVMWSSRVSIIFMDLPVLVPPMCFFLGLCYLRDSSWVSVIKHISSLASGLINTNCPG